MPPIPTDGASMPPTSSSSAAGACANCASELHGPYCSSCGQKAADLRVGVRDLLHELAHELLHLDGKIVRTMKMLVTRPGGLTEDFLDGRRVRYISPIRLYLIWSVVFFAISLLVPDIRSSIVQVDLGTAAEVGAEEAEADRIGQAVLTWLPRAMFVLMPLFAAITWMLFRRKERRFVPHLYHAIHLHAFAFFLNSIAVLLTLAGSGGKIAGAILSMALIPYFYLSLHRVLASGVAGTIVKGAIAASAYMFLITMTAVLIAWSILRV
ncbi:MAG TPA: DUF3667 domain-containing protein [Thermoanaerobaculia bacterium]